ncbi:MAG: type II toxin-antitoxin system VapC family toxin [Terriglobia bacterium]
MLNLDTHLLVFTTLDQLTPGEQRLIAAEDLAISDIVLWELAMLAGRGRVEVDFASPEFRLLHRRLHVIPISLEIARASTRLDFSSDPADEIIAATSIVERIPLLTRDPRILKSRMVPFAK